MIEQCYHNNDGSHCKYLTTVYIDENEHINNDRDIIIERTSTSLSCAWCTLHHIACQRLDYHCTDFIKEFN